MRCRLAAPEQVQVARRPVRPVRPQREQQRTLGTRPVIPSSEPVETAWRAVLQQFAALGRAAAQAHGVRVWTSEAGVVETLPMTSAR